MLYLVFKKSSHESWTGTVCKVCLLGVFQSSDEALKVLDRFGGEPETCRGRVIAARVKKERRKKKEVFIVAVEEGHETSVLLDTTIIYDE